MQQLEPLTQKPQRKSRRAGLARPLKALLLFGFESIRPSPSFLPAALHPAPASCTPRAPPPPFWRLFLPATLWRRRDHSDRESRAGRGRGAPCYADQSASGWLAMRLRGRGLGAALERAGRGPRESPWPAASLPPLLPRSAPQPAPRPGPPGEAPPLPRPPARAPRRRAPPLYSWQHCEPGVWYSGRGGEGPRGLGGSDGGGGGGTSSSSSSSYQPPVPRPCHTSPTSRQPRRPRCCLTPPVGPPANSPGTAPSCPPTRPRPSAPAAASPHRHPQPQPSLRRSPIPSSCGSGSRQSLRRHPGGWDALVQNQLACPPARRAL